MTIILREGMIECGIMTKKKFTLFSGFGLMWYTYITQGVLHTVAHYTPWTWFSAHACSRQSKSAIK